MNRTVFTLICAGMIAGILMCALLIFGMLTRGNPPRAEALRGARFVREVCGHAAV